MRTQIQLALLVLALGGCDLLKPRVDDILVDAGPQSDGPDQPASKILPAGSVVPSVTENLELVTQITINDGLVDATLAMASGIVTRANGKAGGLAVKFWNFGAVTVQDNIIVAAPVYVLANRDMNGVLVPRTDHPFLLDSLPGDRRYSPFRRIIMVPVTTKYNGEVFSTVDAISEAVTAGLVEPPAAAGTWRDIVVVPPGTRLEVSSSAPPADPITAYARGYRVSVFMFGGDLGVQPFRTGQLPSGQESRLLSGVTSGSPPTLPATPDPAPVFQFGIPTVPATTTPNYTPIVIAYDVRLATSVAPSTILNDTSMFKRNAAGAITDMFTDNVASFTVTTVVSNKPMQFVEGQP